MRGFSAPPARVSKPFPPLARVEPPATRFDFPFHTHNLVTAHSSLSHAFLHAGTPDILRGVRVFGSRNTVFLCGGYQVQCVCNSGYTFDMDLGCRDCTACHQYATASGTCDATSDSITCACNTGEWKRAAEQQYESVLEDQAGGSLADC